jgi:hypothetical protein
MICEGFSGRKNVLPKNPEVKETEQLADQHGPMWV